MLGGVSAEYLEKDLNQSHLEKIHCHLVWNQLMGVWSYLIRGVLRPRLPARGACRWWGQICGRSPRACFTLRGSDAPINHTAAAQEWMRGRGGELGGGSEHV